MSVISRIFPIRQQETGQQDSGITDKVRELEGIGIDILQTLIPIRTIAEEELTAFASLNSSENFPSKSILFRGGEQDDSVLYLLEGTVKMKTECGKEYLVDADSAKARFPLSSGRRHSATAVASTDVKVLRVSNRVMASNETPEQKNSFLESIERADIPDEIRNLRIFDAFCQHFSQDKVNIPTLPDVATKLRKAIDQDLSIDRVVEIVQTDASIASKLIQVANCPLFVAKERVGNCREAVIRLGLNATRNLVTSISIKHLINSKDKGIRRRFRELWKQSAHLSCLSFVLASETKVVNPEDALLAGLIADIGMIPFLQFADNFPQELYESNEIDKIIPYIKGLVGIHLLKQWGFPESLTNIPGISENWYHDGGEKLHISDIVILSRLHLHIRNKSMSELPAINAIPACSKLKDGTLSPEYSLNILHNAQDRIRDTLAILAT